MSETDYESLALDAKLLVKAQLEQMSLELKKGPLGVGHSKMLLSIAEWLSEMAMLEKEELENMDPDDKERLREREKKRAQRLRQRREHSTETEGAAKETGGKVEDATEPAA